MYHPRDLDLLLIGGGPAGALLAALVAESGGSVLLVSRRGPGHGLAEETLVPAAQGLLARTGVIEVIEWHRFLAPPTHTAIWGEPRPVVRPPAPVEANSQGFQVHRPTFDAALRTRAELAGATIIEGRVDGSLDDEEVLLRTPTGPLRVHARHRVVATGRSGPGRLTACEGAERGPETIALSSDAPAPPPDMTGNGIEAIRAGWLWWILHRDGGASLSLFCDGEELRGRGSEELWSEAIARAVGPAAGWSAPLRRGVVATTRRTVPTGTAWLVGDAASAIDPLSSQGVEKALASAERVALAIASAIERPAEHEALAQHLVEWEAGLHRAHARRAAEIYRREERFSDATFWRTRRPEKSDMPPPLLLDAELRVAPALRSASTYRPRGSTLVTVEGYALAGAPPIDRIGPIPAGDLVAAARPGGRLSEIVERAGQRPALQGWRRDDVARALELMAARGWLEPKERAV